MSLVSKRVEIDSDKVYQLLREAIRRFVAFSVYIWPALEKLLIATFHIFKALILPITAMVITILTQTVVGNVMLVALAAWFASQLNFDMGDYVSDSLRDTCVTNSDGSVTDLLECIGKGLELVF